MRALVLLPLAMGASPISKVIEMLSAMQDKIVQTAEQEQKLYGEFKDACAFDAQELSNSIKNSKADIEDSKATVTKAGADAEVADAEIAKLSASIAAADKELKEATAVRKQEHSDFQTREKELVETVDTIERAHGIIKRSMQKSNFAQVKEKNVQQVMGLLQTIITATTVQDEDKATLTNLLQAEDDGDSQSGGGQGILDVLSDMQDKAEAQLAETRKAEMTAKFNYDMLKQSLTDKTNNDNKDLAQQKKDKAEATETKATASGELAETQKKLADAQQQLTDVRHECMSRAESYETEVNERTAELGVLAEAKKIIESVAGGGAAKQEYGLAQTEPATLVQLEARSTGVARAVVLIRQLAKKTGASELMQLASRVKTSTSLGGTFDKVNDMIREMITKLEKEMKEEAGQKAYCDKEMKETAAKKEDKSTEVDDASARIDKTAAMIAKYKEEVAKAGAELTEIATATAKAQKLRTDERTTYETAKKDYEEGIAGVEQALKVLRDYYAEKEDAAAFVQVSMKTGDANGIINMLEVALSDFTKSLAELKADEGEAQEAFDTMITENKVRTATLTAESKTKSQGVESATKALSEFQGDRESATTELEAILEYDEKIKDKCIAKPEPFEERMKRKQAEIAGLKQALEILSDDADSFVQVSTVKRHLRRA